MRILPRPRIAAGLRLLPMVGLLLCWVPETRGWTPETRIHMVDEAVRLMPASLRLALERHRDPLRRGLLTPMTHENELEHRPSARGGTLAQQVEREAIRLGQALATEGTDFDALARGFGLVAHFVTDATFPPAATGDDERRYRHFLAFSDSRRERFPVVFYGHEDPLLTDQRYDDYARKILERARVDDDRLARAYQAAGDPPHPSAFDDRSVPFAIASLSYSRTVTDIVRVWWAVWSNAGGDTGRTPYLEPQPALE